MRSKIYCFSVLVICFLVISCKNEVTNKDNGSTNQNLQETQLQQMIEANQKNVAQTPVDDKYPIMTFSEKEFDFGEIKQGDKVEHTFNFKNTGKSNLIITSAQASCGCTVPEYPKNTPIKPGESGEMKVTFNSTGKSGITMKTITVSCNTKSGNELLKIKTTINVPE